MAVLQPERETPLTIDTKPDDAGTEWASLPEWATILTSLAKLEAGLHTVDAELGRLHADLEAFVGSDEVCAEKCGARP